MKTFLVLHLIHLWAQNATLPILTPTGPLYIMNGGSLALTSEIDQDAAVANWIRNAALPILTPTGPLYIMNGGSLTLTCEIDQDAAVVTWQKYGLSVLQITNTTACSFRISSSLDTYNYSMTCGQLRRFTMVKYKVNSSDDNTSWSCQIYSLNYTDLGTSLVVKVLMHVPVGSVQLQNGSSLILIENQSAVLICETDACRPSAAIYWMKDGLNITDYPTNVTAVSVGSYLFVSIGTLTYTGQRVDNRKILTCGAYNGPDSVQTSENLTVTIYYPPSIQGLISPYKVIENQPLNVTCVVSSNPPADQISWSPRGEGSVPSTLYFSSVSRNKSGTYNCTAQNTMIPTVGTRQNGTNASQIQVDVLYPPSIQGLTSPYKVIENETLNVTCEANSNPPADQISWSPNGEDSVPSTLYFRSASRNKSGIYSCTAQNTMTPTAGTQQNGTNTSHMQVDVLYPPSIQGLTSPYKVIENQPLSVTCVVNSNPPADQISWSPSGEGSVPSTLYISSASRNKRGTYSCTAKNTMIRTTGGQQTGTSTNKILVDVLYPPSIQGLTSPFKVIENEPLNVTCEANSNPPADQISWSPSGEGSAPSTLYFRSVSRNKSGIYSCTAQNTMTPTAGTQLYGRNTRQMEVDVLYPPSIQGLTSPHKVIENQPLNVTCVVNSNPPADQISWSPSGEGSVPSTLYFNSVSRNKSGTYNCTAQTTMIPTVGTQLNGTITRQIHVDVLYGAGMVDLSVQGGNTVRENSSAIFKCHVDSNPPSTITWMKENSNTVLKTESGVVQSQYRIESAECLNMGNYTCSANNGIWTTAKERLELFVRCHPRTDFRLPLETKIYRKRHEAAILRYTVISFPPPKFNWTFLGNGSVSRGLPVSASQHDNGQQSELRLTSIGIDGFGNYTVIADNSLSPSAREVFEIIPADVPEVPSYVMIIEITQTSVTVQWMAGNNGGALQTFHVVASAGNLMHNVTLTDPGYRQNGTAVLKGLQPGTKYSIYMVAINSVGSSNMTEAIIISTLEVTTRNSSSSTIPLPAVAGGIGAGVVVILMAVVALFLWRRYHHHNQHSDGIKQDKNERPRPDSGLVDNPVYDSSANVPGPSVNSGATGVEYAKVVKPKKKTSSVDKPSDNYAQVDKTTKFLKKEGEKGRHDKPSRGDIYENADLVRKRCKPDNLYQNSSNAKAEPCDENFYEDAGVTASNGPLKNKDGLLYADLMLDPPLKKNGEVVIRGLENRTEYAEIAYGKRGEPLPESDHE